MTRRGRDHPIRLGMFTGSPVPCKLPIYRSLASTAAGIDFTAIYASSLGVQSIAEGAGVEHGWDVDLLSGYRSVFLARADRSPALGSSIWSVSDPDIIRVLGRERFDVLWLDGYNSVSYLLAVAAQTMLGGDVGFREEQTLLHPRSRGHDDEGARVTRPVSRAARALRQQREPSLVRALRGLRRTAVRSTAHGRERLLPARGGASARAARCATRALRHRRRGRAGDRHRLTPGREEAASLPARVLPQAASRTACALLVAGSGTLEIEMRRVVQRDGIPNVHFAGFLNRTEIPAAHACGDVFKLLSREHETFGLVVPEAMSFGLPIVISDKVGCHADLVSRGLNGYVVSHVDPDAAAAAPGALVADDVLREKMGAASRARIDEWTPQHTVDGVLAAVRHATAAARSR